MIPIIPVPLPRVGHRHPRGQEPHQSDADRQPPEEDQVGRGAQAPLDMRKLRRLPHQTGLAAANGSHSWKNDMLPT